ncbi:MAG: lamin tail domain-containing protein, partial [Chitinophagaceae bacterium]
MLHVLTTSFILLLSFTLQAQTANRHDVVISELMPDPVPSAGLPAEEYIELRNVSPTAFPLSGWKISNGRSVALIAGTFVLQPDSVLILCATVNVPLFSSFGRTLGVSNFPALDNDAGVISLVSRQGRTIDAVAYTKEWYKNSIKSAGGWSLEII